MMASASIEKELLGCERDYWQAMKNKDVAAMHALTDYPCILTGAQGIGSIDKAHMSAMMETANWTLKEFTFSGDAQVRLLSDDVAVVAYQVHEDLTVDGTAVALDAAETSVWVRRNGRWLCAAHAEAISGDPYGRDRIRQAAA
jgi:ketosteroid isomerase-like protein